jgi:His/Glu/Gln/Arg/opine family amino acid ABC transporter permease subunit
LLIDLNGYGWMLWEGAKVTIAVSICGMLVALALGLIGAWGALSKSRFSNRLIGVYTTVIRGVPPLLLLLVVYYGTPTLIQNTLARFGVDVIINFTPFIAGFLAIGFVLGAFATEVFRGAFLAVPKGQIEAGLACGMSRTLVLRRITLPQVWRYALPGLSNVWLVLLKATALCAIIQLPELLRNADIAARAVKRPFIFYLSASLIYLAITTASTFLMQHIEARANRGFKRA